MRRIVGTSIGKTVGKLAALRGGGQALPGLIVERLLPSYLASMLEQLPDGVVIITGTNGKTTTTKMVVELLQSTGRRVLTNPTGSNFTRGIISSLSRQAGLGGKLSYDIGVFELDEAYARHFVAQVKPRWVLALNVMRDQLDRFGELDTAAQLVAAAMREATEGIVVNADDVRLSAIAREIKAEKNISLQNFGVSSALRKFFPADDEIVAVAGKSGVATATVDNVCEKAAELVGFSEKEVTFAIDDREYKTALAITGQHNFQNAAAALALVRQLAPGAAPSELVNYISLVNPAFGRGERFALKDGSSLQLLLVKNPAGFRQTLASYDVHEEQVMFAINDNYADSRDVSWLWDVDFTTLSGKIIPLTTGSRAADMALRLHYDDIAVVETNPRLEPALRAFCALPGEKILISTYTAMLCLYKILKKEAGTTL